MNRLELLKESLALIPSSDNKLLADLKWMIGEIDQLMAVLKPFAVLAKGIPADWPGAGRVRVLREYGTERLCYYCAVEEHNKQPGILPTVAEWRKAAEAAR